MEFCCSPVRLRNQSIKRCKPLEMLSMTGRKTLAISRESMLTWNVRRSPRAVPDRPAVTNPVMPTVMTAKPRAADLLSSSSLPRKMPGICLRSSAFSSLRLALISIRALFSSELNKALMEIKANLKELNAELLKQIPGIFLGKLEELSKSAARGFAVMTVGITGFVTAGLSGTALGERLTFQLSMLSREIANVFLPVIESISNGLQRLIDWFRSLTGEQQNSIAYWSVFGITVLGIVGTIGKVIAIVRELKTALAGLAIVQALLNGLTLNFAAIAGGIAAVALVGGTLALANEAGKAATGGATASSGKGGSRTGAPQIKEFDKLGRPIYYEPGEISNVTGQPIRGGVARNQLDNASSGFSSLQETFRRVQLAALRQNVGITNEEKQLLAQERTARATEATASYLQKKKPALGS